MDFLRKLENTDIIIESFDDDFCLILDESISAFSVKAKTPGVIDSFKQFVTKHPFLTGVAVTTGLTALAAYQKNKKLTARFFATTPYERALYKNIADTLIASGNYSHYRMKRVNGGYMYEVVKK